jgi:hypothetical protein
MSTSTDKKLAKKTKASKEQQFGSTEAVSKKSSSKETEAMAALLKNIGCKKYRMEMVENTALALAEVLPVSVNKIPNESSRLAKAAVLIKAFDPVNPLEAMLATQMGAVHTLVLAEAKRASHATYLDSLKQHTNQATKLSRLFLEQVAVYERLKGKGQQKIIVEKVTVESGGQAAIGVYEPRGGNVKK